MEPITMSMLLVASVAPKIIQYGFQSAENKRNQREARVIGQQNRQDTLSYNRRINELNKNTVDLEDKKLSHSRSMMEQGIQLKNQELNKDIYQQSKKNITETADNLGFNKNTNFLRSRILGNY